MPWVVVFLWLALGALAWGQPVGRVARPSLLSVTDGEKCDITVSAAGECWDLDTDAITDAHVPDDITITQAASAGQTRITLLNATTTGTVVNKLVTLTGAPSTGVLPSVGSTADIIGVCINNCGSTGSAEIVVQGLVECEFDGATTAGNYVGISDTVDGECQDVGETEDSVRLNCPGAWRPSARRDWRRWSLFGGGFQDAIPSDTHHGASEIGGRHRHLREFPGQRGVLGERHERPGVCLCGPGRRPARALL